MKGTDGILALLQDIKEILYGIALLILGGILCMVGAVLSLEITFGGFLILIGIMTVHQFSMPKTIGTILIAVVGMAAIMVLFLLFFTMLQQMINFGKIAYFELFKR